MDSTVFHLYSADLAPLATNKASSRLRSLPSISGSGLGKWAPRAHSCCTDASLPDRAENWGPTLPISHLDAAPLRLRPPIHTRTPTWSTQTVIDTSRGLRTPPSSFAGETERTHRGAKETHASRRLGYRHVQAPFRSRPAADGDRANQTVRSGNYVATLRTRCGKAMNQRRHMHTHALTKRECSRVWAFPCASTLGSMKL
jgi:hypothetical protein